MYDQCYRLMVSFIKVGNIFRQLKRDQRRKVEYAKESHSIFMWFGHLNQFVLRVFILLLFFLKRKLPCSFTRILVQNDSVS